MKSTKIIFYAVGACIALIAAVAAIVIFQSKIVEFFVSLKDKLEETVALRRCSSEYKDYADI